MFVNQQFAICVPLCKISLNGLRPSRPAKQRVEAFDHPTPSPYSIIYDLFFIRQSKISMDYTTIVDMNYLFDSLYTQIIFIAK